MWSKGDYFNATNQQDDIAVIAGKVGLAPQQNGNSLPTATALAPSVTGTTAVATAAGVVAQSGVADFFKFEAVAGTATVSARVTAPWTNSDGSRLPRSNLDVLLTVYDASGAVVTTINPAGVNTDNGLGVAATAVALRQTGVYYIAIQGAGAGDRFTTGYRWGHSHRTGGCRAATAGCFRNLMRMSMCMNMGSSGSKHV